MRLNPKPEKMKMRLENFPVTGQSYNGEVVVTANGSRRVLSVDINDSVLKVREKHEIEQMIVVAVNNATEKADQLMAVEMKAIMPNIPGLGL